MTSPAELRQKAVDQPILVIDIGGTGIKFGYSIGGQPHAFCRVFSTQALRGGDPIDALASMAELVVAEAGLVPRFIVATMPGFIDTDGDHVLSAGNIPSLNGRALASELASSTGCPVFLERDAVLILMGEALAGVAQDREHVLGMIFGTGIGTAYLQDGKPFRGGGWAPRTGPDAFPGRRARSSGYADRLPGGLLLRSAPARYRGSSRRANQRSFQGRREQPGAVR